MEPSGGPDVNVGASRQDEFAVRLAVGAPPRDVVRFVAAHRRINGCSGIALGLLAGFGATQALRTLLFGVGTLDVTTHVAVIVLVVLVVTLAVYVPARRAAGIDPVVLLRRE